MKWLPPPPCRVPAVAIEAARIMAIKQKRKDFVFIAMQRVLNIIHLKPGKVVKFEGERGQSLLLALFSGLRSTAEGRSLCRYEGKPWRAIVSICSQKRSSSWSVV